MGNDPNFATVPMWPEYWLEVQSWFKARGQEPPARPIYYVLVSDLPVNQPEMPHVFVALYPTAGPYVVVERVATNPKSSLRKRHGAMLYGCAVLKAYAEDSGKTMLCFPTEAGVGAVLQRAGFVFPKCAVMRYVPRQ